MQAFAIQLVCMGTTFIFPATLLANSLKFNVKYVLSSNLDYLPVFCRTAWLSLNVIAR